MKIKSKEQLDTQIKLLKQTFGDLLQASNLSDIQKFFKDNFNEDIVQAGDKLIYDFAALFNIVPEMRRKFNGDNIQPITITYKRLDIIFFTYDKHPELGEQYITLTSDWMKWLFPVEVKQSILWAKKASLREKNPNEYYIQVNSFEINNKYTKLIKDIDFSEYK